MTKPLKAITFEDLNPYRMGRSDEWKRGVLDAANLINDLQLTTNHQYAIGDCLLAKLNLLRKGKRIRKWKAVSNSPPSAEHPANSSTK